MLYPVKGEMIRNDLLELVPDNTVKVLSVGCGTCRSEMLLVKNGMTVYGIERNSNSCAIAAERITKVVCGDIENDEFQELSGILFDCIIIGDVLEHVYFPEKLIDKAIGWLTPGGCIIISVPNFSNFKAVYALFIKRDWVYTEGGLFDFGHIRIFTRKSLMRLITKSGLYCEALHFNRYFFGKSGLLLKWFVAPLAYVIPLLNDFLVQQWVLRLRVNKKN